MFIKKVNLVLAALCTIFFQGIFSLELYSEERINQWKVDIVIEKKPTEELIKSRKAELDEKIRREREAAEKEGTHRVPERSENKEERRLASFQG